MLFDAHTHLNFEKYTDEERRSLASEIEQSEVACLIDVASDVESAKQALRDADDYSWCYAAVGIHPDQAPKYKDAATPEEASEMMDADIEEIRKLAAHPKAVKALILLGGDRKPVLKARRLQAMVAHAQ